MAELWFRHNAAYRTNPRVAEIYKRIGHLEDYHRDLVAAFDLEKSPTLAAKIDETECQIKKLVDQLEAE